MDDTDVLPYVRDRIPGFSEVGAVERLPEGNLNDVWRVKGAGRSVIVKHAPPYVASNSDIPLDPSRLVIEARCLDALGPNESLGTLRGRGVRGPALLDANTEDFVLVMEDLGELPSMDKWLRSVDNEAEGSAAARFGRTLGRFIGSLHAATCHDERYVGRFENRPMQETRLEVQYRSVEDMLDRAGVPDAAGLGETAVQLGERLLQPGRCLIMGDLWPSSVLVGDGGLRLIDWELAHYGRPLQDIAHWLAHLWMQEHTARSARVKKGIRQHRDAFLRSYSAALDEADADLWPSSEHRDASVHFGAEILVRALGPFQEGYVYEGLPPDHPLIETAVEVAIYHLRVPEEAPLVEGALDA